MSCSLADQCRYRFVSVKVELDHGTHCCMSPDGKAFILTQENNQTVNIYKLIKKEDGKVIGQLSLEFPPVWAFKSLFVCTHLVHMCNKKKKNYMYKLWKATKTPIELSALAFFLVKTCV